jgi:hypothetical protein
VQQKFLIRTNHKNLKYFKSPQKTTAHQARWNTFLQDYDFEIMHIPGKNNTVANLLSQRKDFEGGVNPSPSITILPEQLFVCKIYQSTKTYLEDTVTLKHNTKSFTTFTIPQLEAIQELLILGI